MLTSVGKVPETSGYTHTHNNKKPAQQTLTNTYTTNTQQTHDTPSGNPIPNPEPDLLKCAFARCATSPATLTETKSTDVNATLTLSRLTNHI